MDTTRTFSVSPSSPGTMHEMPRTNSVTGTPACEASTSFSITSLSVMEFVLKNSPLGSPACARAICASMPASIMGLICSGATHMIS